VSAAALVLAVLLAVQPAAQEIVREVRVHGNSTLTDDEVLKFAGVTVGSPLEPDAVAAITKRLKQSGKFETVEVRKRYRSLEDPTDVAIVLVVHETAGVLAGDGPAATAPFRRLKNSIMFLPILNYTDGYGLTYGARFSTVNLLGAGERLSTPLTWGGTRKAALEFERPFTRGPLTRITGAASIYQRENPRFEIDDRRVEFKAGVDRDFAHHFRIGADTSRADVSFGELDDEIWTVGATAALDTRGDPIYPANAIYVGTGWNGLHVNGGDRINRFTGDARGYLRVFRQSVVAGRLLYSTSDAPLPRYERLLVGGAYTLRGWDAGAFDGDRMLVTSVEARVPLTSVISGGKIGVMGFFDAAKAIEQQQTFKGKTWQRGAGGGLFLIAAIVKLNFYVAHGLDGGGTRVHLASGFSF
jgi:outer membrane protein assembly factor BamA